MKEDIKLHVERMFRSLNTDDFYDEGWFDEASKDDIKGTEEVYVIPPRILNSVLEEVFKAGSKSGKDSVGSGWIPEDLRTCLESLGIRQSIIRY